MSQIVRCDICGGIYNQSYLGSHKRLAHGKRKASSSRKKPTLEAIVSLYGQLPEKKKREVLHRLAEETKTKL